MGYRYQARLTPSQPTLSLNLDFEAVCIVVTNLTASDVVIRQGANEIPTIATADIIVPAASQSSYAVVGRWFGIGFADVALVDSPTDPIESGLAGTATILALGAGETIPSLGSVSFQSLSLSPLSNGLTVFAGNTVTPTYDLGPWGGVIIHVNPGAGTGQGILQTAISNDGVNFHQFELRAFWPSIPMTIAMPRVARYIRWGIFATSIVGQPAISGLYSVRATLSEISKPDYQISGQPISNAYNVANLSESNWTLATYGLPSIAIAVRNTGGTGSYGQLIIETGISATGPWAFVTTREQNIAAGTLNASMYRTMGTLGNFTRIRLLNNGIAGPIVGTIEFSIQSNQDLAGVLHDIYRALGDPSEPVNVGQNLYALLAQIDNTLDTYQPQLGWLATINASLDNIELATDTLESLINTSNAILAAIEDEVDQLESLMTTNNTLLTGIDTRIATTNTSLSSIDTRIATTNTSLATVNTNLSDLLSRQKLGNTSTTFQTNIAAASVYQNVLPIVPGFYITGINISYICGAPLSESFEITLAFGNGAGATSVLVTSTGPQPTGTIVFNGLASNRQGGILIPVGATNLWARSSIAGTTIICQIFLANP